MNPNQNDHPLGQAQDYHPQKKADLSQNILATCLGFTEDKMSKSNIIASILLLVGLGCFFNPFSGMIGEVFLPILAFILIVLGALPCALYQSFD